MLDRSYLHGLGLAAILIFAAAASSAQQIGQNLKFDGLDGNLSFGYNGAFGEGAQDQTAFDISADGTLRGFYYDPNFISFSIQPYFNRSQVNSGFQSISNSSGFNANANLFSGTHFPGSISFNKTYNGTGSYGIPGLGGFSTRGSSQGIAVGWSLLFPNRPTLNVSYGIGSGSSELYGTSGNSSTGTKTLNLRSTYSLQGFRLDGYFTHGSVSSSFPHFLTDGTSTESNTGSNTLGAAASHRLPMRGTFNVGWSHYAYTGEFAGVINRGSANNLNAQAVLNPFNKLGVSFGADYDSNAYASLNEQVIAAGGKPVFAESAPARNFRLYASAGYAITSHLNAQGYINRYEQFFGHGSHSATQYGGSLNFTYSKPLFGILSCNVGAVDMATQMGNTGTGFVGNVNMSRTVRGWDLSADASYSQNVQTLVLFYTTSRYSFGGSVRRRFWTNAHWNASFRSSRTGLTRESGTFSHAETLSTSLSFRRYVFTANYSQSAGASVLTATGLTPTPTPVPLPNEVVLYNGRSFGAGINVIPMRRFTITMNYQRALSDTATPSHSSNNRNEMFNGLARWQVRKMLVTAGFTRFNQSVSAAGTKPSVVNSYYFGISRWFSIF